MEIKGYKAFDSQMNNRYGKRFEEGNSYEVDGTIVFGVEGNGFHFCKRLEDTLRYVDGMSDDISIAEVIGRGEIIESFDDYYGYYDMYAASSIEIVRVLSRVEIINHFLNANSDRTARFVQGFRLTDIEKAWLRAKHSGNDKVLNAIAYYQDGDKGVYDSKLCYTYKKVARFSKGGNYE